jgi:hypothetical protein
MTAAEVLELLERGRVYELHIEDCDLLRLGSQSDYDCNCPGPDLLKEIKEVLRNG